VEIHAYQEEFVITKGQLVMSAKYRYLNCGLILSVLFLTFAPNAAAEGATSSYYRSRHRSFSGPFHSAEDIERNRTSLRQILLTRFDFTAMAEKSLGNHWKDLDGMEAEFVSTFTDFVEHSYMSTLGSYRGEKVVYDRDWSDGESAEVDTRVVGGRGTPIKIAYKVHLTGGQWMVYDALSMTSALLEISISVRENSSDGLVGGTDSKPAS
jgi:ABC-type transporter MlaC component